MGKHYTYARIECPECGQDVARNWYLRHMAAEHPQEDEPEDQEPKLQSDSLDEAYSDRNQAAMLAAKLAAKLGYPVGWRVDPEEPDWPILFIELPSGQVSWHIPMAEALDHGAPIEERASEPVWDGHDLEEKRYRLWRFIHYL